MHGVIFWAIVLKKGEKGGVVVQSPAVHRGGGGTNFVSFLLKRRGMGKGRENGSWGTTSILSMTCLSSTRKKEKRQGPTTSLLVIEEGEGIPILRREDVPKEAFINPKWRPEGGKEGKGGGGKGRESYPFGNSHA